VTYTVIWKTFQLDRLAEIYVSAGPIDRDRMAAGIEGFNAQLAADPLAVGESRDRGYRVAFPSLLCVYFNVDQVRRLARVARSTATARSHATPVAHAPGSPRLAA